MTSVNDKRGESILFQTNTLKSEVSIPQKARWKNTKVPKAWKLLDAISRQKGRNNLISNKIIEIGGIIFSKSQMEIYKSS